MFLRQLVVFQCLMWSLLNLQRKTMGHNHRTLTALLELKKKKSWITYQTNISNWKSEKIILFSLHSINSTGYLSSSSISEAIWKPISLYKIETTFPVALWCLLIEEIPWITKPLFKDLDLEFDIFFHNLRFLNCHNDKNLQRVLQLFRVPDPSEKAKPFSWTWYKLRCQTIVVYLHYILVFIISNSFPYFYQTSFQVDWLVGWLVLCNCLFFN